MIVNLTKYILVCCCDDLLDRWQVLYTNTFAWQIINPICWPQWHQEAPDWEQASRSSLLGQGALGWERTVATGRNLVEKCRHCLHHMAGNPLPLVALQFLILWLKVSTRNHINCRPNKPIHINPLYMIIACNIIYHEKLYWGLMLPWNDLTWPDHWPSIYIPILVILDSPKSILYLFKLYMQTYFYPRNH